MVGPESSYEQAMDQTLDTPSLSGNKPSLLRGGDLVVSGGKMVPLRLQRK